MSRRPARVTQADVARALRAVEQCGSDRVVEIAPDGTIRIVPPAQRQPQPSEHLDDGSPIEL